MVIVTLWTTKMSWFDIFVTFSVIMNDKKVTISQFYDLFRNYEWQKGHNLVIMNDIVNNKNSPIKGWGGLSKMSKMSIIELSRLGQDLFDLSGLTWAHP